MIGWLEGRLAEPWQQAQRFGALLICHGVGYEVMLSARHWQALPAVGSSLALHVHTQVRDDGWTLYAFPARHERELFRELVAVSGVGPQMALGLLGEMEAEHLARAIVQADLRRLSQAPGVGRRTAERLAVELRQRLQQRFPELLAGEALAVDGAEGDPISLLADGPREEVQQTLASLGFEPLEIHRALRAVAAGLTADAGSDDWIRESLRWLSRPAA
ncbi:MAG: Holliday junction branch migration protein RuvA [Synechococcaceae cyanobacterium]|nr:Holliday junction branch migration protein RuvA [Synechococcaceae cyanobacterium]